MRRIPRTSALLAFATSIIAASGIRCGGTTGDHRVHFGGSVIGSGPDGVTSRGWALHFDQFVAALGPVRIYSDDAFIARTHVPAPFPAFANIGVAFAQHCHGCPRAPVAEFGFESGGAVFAAVDLLATTPFALGPANARNGWYRSASFTFTSPVAIADGGVLGTALEGHSMRVRGTATRGADVVSFFGSLDLHPQRILDDPATERPYTTYGVMFDNPDGVFVDDTNETTDAVVIRIDLARLFDQADFASLPTGSTSDAPREITSNSQVADAWRLGSEDPRAYRVGWTGAGGHGIPADVPITPFDGGR